MREGWRKETLKMVVKTDHFQPRIYFFVVVVLTMYSYFICLYLYFCHILFLFLFIVCFLYLSYASDSQYLLSPFSILSTSYLYCHASTYHVKFFVRANLLGNKFDSDSDSDVVY